MSDRLPAVPMLDLGAQFAPIRDEVLEAIVRVCDSQRFILGPEVEALERELAGRLGVAHAIGVSSGTDALLAALMALGVGPGDEVVTTPYSFFATAGSIVRLGARPVFVDIDPATFNLRVDAVDAAITARTRAVIPVHLFGLMADMVPLLEIARARGIPVVEDAAQAILARRDGLGAGSVGALGCFSFFPTKNLGAFGDAGLVTSNDAGLADRVRMIRVHGQGATYVHPIIGGNFRIDALQAAVLRVKARHLDGWTEARRRNAARYRDLFREAGLDLTVRLPEEPPGAFHVYHQFVVRLPARDRVRAELEAQGIATAVYYPVPFHLQECFRSLGYREGDFPEAERAARESLALPVYSEITPAQQARVVEAIARVYREAPEAARPADARS